MNNNSTSSHITSKQLSTNANNTKGRYYYRANSSKKDYNSIANYRYNYEDNNNYNNLNKTQDIPYADVGKLIEPFSPQGDVCDLMNRGDRQNDRNALPSSFDLDKIIHKYGENPDLLQLILSSKVEEDRRRAEEARLKQKELDYIVSDKGNFYNITLVSLIFT
ncbi:hypothetical protein EDC94DRAFT_607867 [Helicostylum pulchrum]|nr:hypothetical protein EDC94DRAFT_607867 [Helicostylum pulchrum]